MSKKLWRVSVYKALLLEVDMITFVCTRKNLINNQMKNIKKRN